MDKNPAPEIGTDTAIKPFSVLLSPTATLAVQSGAFIRSLRYRGLQRVGDNRSPKSSRPEVSDLLIAVRAQPCTLHLFKGHILCQVVIFSSPITDVVGIPWSEGHLGSICAVVCRDGSVYKLPASVALDGGRPPVPGPSKKGEERTSTKKPSSSSSLDIFDDLAPTRASPQTCSSPNLRHGRESDAPERGGEGEGHSGGLVIDAPDSWLLFRHYGAVRITTCPGRLAVVSGIVDRTSLYSLAAGDPHQVGRRVRIVEGVDGAAPTASSVVWMEHLEGKEEYTRDTGIPLPVDIFQALFGSEVAMSSSCLLSPSEPKVGDTNPEDGRGSQHPGKPAVILVGDKAGVVRWAPLFPCPGIHGGVLADVGQPIVATLPFLDSEARTAGLVIVGAGGAVMTLTVVRQGLARKRGRSDAPSEHEAGGGANTDTGCEELEVPRVCRRRLKLPFPVASVSSTPGFIVHSHAGALFASPLPGQELRREHGRVQDRCPRGDVLDHGSTNRADQPAFTDIPCRSSRPADSSEGATPLRPTRLPLPCGTLDVAASRVLVKDDGTAGGGLTDAQSVRTVIVALSARGRVVAFLAPRSVEELEGWALDTGKGGVRVGGSAILERRVRCQLERLSSVGRHCGALSAESAARDREILTLRGASRLIPALVKRQRERGPSSDDPEGPGPTKPLAHHVAMTLDPGEVPPMKGGIEGISGSSEADCLHVRLHVRVWVPPGRRSRRLPEAGEEGPGRWFITNELVSDPGIESEEMVEGWAWSTSAPLPMLSLRQGREWNSSTSLALPCARPVTVTTWLRFRFNGELEAAGRGVSGSSDGGSRAVVTRRGPRSTEEAGGLCVQLGTARFDILDWGVRLPSVPGSDALLRGAARGRGACFAGPEAAASGVLEEPVPSGTATAGRLEARPSVAARVPPSWGKFSIQVAAPGVDAGTLLEGLLDPSRGNLAASANGCAPKSLARCGRVSDVAYRVGGQVAVLQARECKSPGTVEDPVGDPTANKVVEIAVSCSHEAMAPLVRQALLYRARDLSDGRPRDGVGGASESSTGGGATQEGVNARLEAATRLSRELHLLGQACTEASDSAGVLDAARARDGPQWESAREGRELMGRVGEIYQALRTQQEGSVVL